MLERARAGDPELFATWWDAGARLDARAVTALATELIDRVLASQ